MRLSHDIARCHDKTCPLNDICLRFLCRTPDLCGPRTPHWPSLDDCKPGLICESFIEYRGEEEVRS